MSDRSSAIWSFRDLAEEEGLDAAVWGASTRLLKVYATLGLTALPLGVDGMPSKVATEPYPDGTKFLVCKVERDLKALLPILPRLLEAEKAG